MVTREAQIAFVLAVTVACLAQAGGRNEGTATRPQLQFVNLAVEGIPNALSAAVLETVLLEQPGIYTAQVSHRSRRAAVELDRARTGPEGLVELIAGLSTTYTASLLPDFVRSAAIRIPEINSPEVAEDVNLLVSRLRGIAGGSIRPGLVTVDFDSRVTSAEQIASALGREMSLSTPNVTMPAADEPVPENSAQVVVRIPTMTDYREALSIADKVQVPGVYDGRIDLEARTLAVIYEIPRTTAPMISAALEAALGGEVEVVTVDRAGKPVGLNVHGWFVVGMSSLGLLASFGIYKLSRRFKPRTQIRPEGGRNQNLA